MPLFPTFHGFAGFFALFRKAGRTKELDLGLTSKELEQLDKKLFDEGFRLSFLYEWTENGGDNSYQAAWEPGDGAQFWLVTDSAADLEKQEAKHRKNGLRFKYLRANDGRFTAIWQPGAGEQSWLADASFHQFKSRDSEMRARGLRLMRMCDDHGAYTGFWQPGSPDYDWISEGETARDTDNFNTFIEEEEKKGKRAVSFGGESLCAVLHPGGEAQRFIFHTLEKEFREAVEKNFQDGFRIVDLFINNLDSI
jgi:hypothetical protein